MTAPTPVWNIPLFGVGDTIGPLAGVFNSQSNALETALNTMQTKAYVMQDTLAHLQGVTGTQVGQKGTVYADSTATNNGDYFWSGTVWVQFRIKTMTPRLLGEVYVPQASQTLLGTSMTNVGSATLSATTSGGLIRVTVTGAFNNAGSGANRGAQLQILCDGSLVGEVFPGSGQAFVGYISGNNSTPFTHKARHTPSAGSHTWQVQGLASAASAVYASQVTLTVEEFV